MIASELYALTQELKCNGPDNCYWCGTPCQRVYPHGDTPPQARIGVKRVQKVTRPGSSYICEGCRVWKRTRITVKFLNPACGFKDRQDTRFHSWFITDKDAYAIKHPDGISPNDDAASLYEKLLNPPHIFALSLIDPANPTENFIQNTLVNTNDTIKNSTEFTFTLNNIAHTYTIYELEEALKTNQLNGKSSGVRELIKLFGPYTIEDPEVKDIKRGRPVQDKTRINVGEIKKVKPPVKK